MPETDLKLSEAEFPRLIREAPSGASVAVAFGPRGVWLEKDTSGAVVSAWAIPLLQLWRGETVADGAAI